MIYLPDTRNIATGIKIYDAKTGKLITENEEGVWRLMDLESKEASSEDESKLDRRHRASDSHYEVSPRLCPGFPDTQMNL